LYGECRAGAQIIFPKGGRGLGHVTPTISIDFIGVPVRRPAPRYYNRYYTRTVYVGIVDGRKIIKLIIATNAKKVDYDHLHANVK